MTPSAARLNFFLKLLLCLLLCGCGTSHDIPVPVATPTVEKIEPKKPDSKEPAREKPVAMENSEKLSKEEPSSEEQAFEPPYPDREHLFLAPRRSSVNKESSGSVQQSVELLGFANVQGPRVILAIDGIVVPLPEGASQSGIEVISIKPPAVVLQRNRDRWQATLEN